MIKDKLIVVKKDITVLQVDVIVNAANASLLGGGGVDGAIHRAAGPSLMAACKKIAPCATGQAKITEGFRLPAKYVIHAVGPIWRGGSKGEPKLLASCYTTSLRIATNYGLKSIAFPAISCGIYGYPISQAATIAVKETANYLSLHNTIELVYFTCFDDATFSAYEQALDHLNDE